MADGCDVTIILVRKEQGRTKKRKRRSTMEHNSVSTPLATIRLDLTTLRECSKYFDTWVTQRTAMDGDIASEFHLQTLTSIAHYRDCFSRMYTPRKPFTSIRHCLGLLKVATQIDFQDLTNRGLTYLTTVPWSEEDEHHVREFTHVSPSHLTRELCARLRVPSHGELCLVLDQYMRLAISGNDATRKMFAEMFHGVVASSGPGKSRRVLQHALKLVREESEKLLSHVVARELVKGPESEKLLLEDGGVAAQAVLSFCWLFGVAREVDAAEEMVVVLLRADDPAKLLRGVAMDSFPVHVREKWAKMMFQVFRDVLDGRMSLGVCERLGLFWNWNWVLQEACLDKEVVAGFVGEFIRSFAFVEQREFFVRWVKGLGDDPQRILEYDLSVVHGVWVKELVSKAMEVRGPECGLSNWELGRGGSEEDIDARWNSFLLIEQKKAPLESVRKTES